MSGYMNTAKSSEWPTPQEFFDKLNDEFHFTTDVCATSENTKCPEYFTKEQDGLKQDWRGVCWCNPPYGKGIDAWVRKAAQAKATVVMLLPARTDTKWFHDLVYGKAEIRFVRGRLKFGCGGGCAPFPSMIVIFRKEKHDESDL